MQPLNLGTEIPVAGPLKRIDPRGASFLVLGTEMVGAGAVTRKRDGEGGVVGCARVYGTSFQNDESYRFRVVRVVVVE